MKEYTVAVSSVKESGEIIKKHFMKVGYKLKGKANPVTLADIQSQNLIVKTLRKNFPSHSIIAEESGLKKTYKDKVWILDPLDGTVNYTHGYPHCAISLAYVSNNSPVIGLIYNPIQNELFSSVRGKGSFLNGKKIKVSSNKAVKDSLLATGFPYDRAKKAQFYCSFYAEFLKISHDIRRTGAASLDMAWTACGRLDGYWEFNLKPWDVAAAALIACEAGGKVTDFRGIDIFNVPILKWGKETLCSNGLIHEEMLSLINHVQTSS